MWPAPAAIWRPQHAPLRRGPAPLRRRALLTGRATPARRLPCPQALPAPPGSRTGPRRGNGRARAFSIASAVFTGTVDFSTTILLVVDTEAIMRAAPSQYVRSAALPAPTPRVLVGVFTLRAVAERLRGLRGARAAPGAGPAQRGGAEQEGGRGERRRARHASAAREAAVAPASAPRTQLARGRRLTELPWPWLGGCRRACCTPGQGALCTGGSTWQTDFFLTSQDARAGRWTPTGHLASACRLLHPSQPRPPRQAALLLQPLQPGRGAARGRAPDEDDVALRHVLVRVGGEEEVAPARRLHHLLQPRLVDGQLAAAHLVPRVDPRLVDVHHHDLDLRALVGDHRHGRPCAGRPGGA